MKELIKKIIDVSYKSKCGHIPSALSILDVVYVLYDKILNIDDLKNNKLERDRFILSKGHGCLSLYVVLNHVGLILDDELNDFCNFDSMLGGHPDSIKIPYIESSTGSLGHGLPIGVGMSLGYKMKGIDKNIYVIIGDGESNEGTVWESALISGNHKLNNLYCMLDHNQSNNRSLKIDSMTDKFKSFGWETFEIDGHDQNEIEKHLKIKSDKPIFIQLNTIKGKGCLIMENNPEWHYKQPTKEEYEKIISEL